MDALKSVHVMHFPIQTTIYLPLRTSNSLLDYNWSVWDSDHFPVLLESVNAAFLIEICIWQIGNALITLPLLCVR